MRWNVRVWVLIGLLVGSLIPAGLSLADENAGAGAVEPMPPEIQNATQEQVIARHIVDVLTKLSTITENIMGNTTLPENSSILQHYELAEQYRDSAMNAYESGDYYTTILDGLTAMHHYKVVLESLRKGKENLRDRFFEEARRMGEYFKMAEHIINAAQKQGIDVGNAPELLNETREAYRAVLDDIKEKDFAKAREDLQAAREKKAALDEQLRDLKEQLAYENAEEVVKVFLNKTQRGIEIAEKAIELWNERGADVSKLENLTERVKAIYDEVNGLAGEEKWEDALGVIQENGATLREFSKAVSFIQRKAYERQVEEKIKDAKAFIRELNGRIRKDGKALRELKKEGVDTRKAELHLKVAMQEVRLGIGLLKHKKPMQAKAHFAIALDMLHRVDEFILWHA
ncbi:hypothetical protein [Thermococcus celer]|uniref:DNA double-strand break repair Rad50 ATPase n=1 Tax=Thermococcus celer Vu 13 = JCM 8558 TaxID=1293037 RepID=A0A218NZN3_THECE|nr:hypothetical protein [Thermococcus celer]ASI98138.1 hypothetical protein A3L02_00420 [Thermococcus celer Vu 13 = JCM 8558]